MTIGPFYDTKWGSNNNFKTWRSRPLQMYYMATQIFLSTLQKFLSFLQKKNKISFIAFDLSLPNGIRTTHLYVSKETHVAFTIVSTAPHKFQTIIYFQPFVSSSCQREILSPLYLEFPTFQPFHV